MTEINMNIRKYRRKKGLSQEKLAEQLNVTRQTVSNWETGKAYPDVDMVIRLSTALETDPNHLLYPADSGKGKKEFRSVSVKAIPLVMVLFFALLIFPFGGIWGLLRHLIGGGAEESFLYPIYIGIILLAGLIVLCTCVVLEELRMPMTARKVTEVFSGRAKRIVHMPSILWVRAI